ncbi:non-specific serine/threonine protein kinase/serine/threonine-protein kinase [Prosthecobacter fusiformis]|uniref:Non-specific serine/threonine protein kinase/serine/threonine-protein kinase n=2 Tax=Prosthecobacter fusiformis TaxID=48464 RepID=A0A4R7RKR2_9BACT|nr:non-specific serine/threonine protein kinase/serine/threonine-protein kinase [Prosthecobacter fusiformis]
MLDLALEPAVEGGDVGLLEQTGDIIGSYTLEKKLGEGGFGIVWQAVQTEPIRRTVALKVIRPGMDSLAVLSRFRTERRALERMSHPNIALVLDAGTTPLGRPFFVLELVKGRAITSYCEEAGLDRRQRISLFMDVCRAIQHAHQRAVLHRDLKPSNILVADGDDGPVAKVIDFGIAKALSEDADSPDSLGHTLRGMVLGTPEYMAPEQAAMGVEAVDVRVDVYSLGAILYQLLTGVPPLEAEAGTTQKTSLTAMLQRIYEVDPVRPSVRARQRQAQGKHSPCKPEELVGDLDWIILKALEKNPERRYDSANALADDLKRHLEDEPVSAGPPDRWYRFQKLVRRNRTAFAVGTVIGVNVLILACVSTLAFMRESEARRNSERLRSVAESQSRKAHALTGYLTELLTKAGEFVSQGKNPEALRLALNESVKEVEQLNAEPALQIEVLERLANIMMAMGDARSALPLVKRLHELMKTHHGEAVPRTLAAQLLLARAYSEIGDKPEALRLYQQMDAAWLTLGPSYSAQRQTTAKYHARELVRQGRGREAMALVQTDLLTASNDAREKSLGLLFMADLQSGMKDYEGAEKTLLDGLRLVDSLPIDQGGSRRIFLRSLSRVKASQGDYVQAAKHLEDIIQMGASAQGADHHSLVARWIEVAHLYLKTDRVQDAFRATDEAMQISRRQDNNVLLPRALRAAAEVREKAGQFEAALAYRRECMEMERLYNTDRGKWIYELSQIVLLESKLHLYDDVKRDAALLWQRSQTEPAVTTDPPFMRSICKILTEACEKWQKATGSLAFQDDILEWKTLTAQGVVQQ